jgi:hypothetical protein
LILKNKKTAFGYKGVCRMHAKTGGGIISLKSDDYKKKRNLSAAFATCLVTHMLQMQLIQLAGR